MPLGDEPLTHSRKARVPLYSMDMKGRGVWERGVSVGVDVGVGG